MKKILLLFIVATIFSCQEKSTNEVSEVKKKEFVSSLPWTGQESANGPNATGF